MSINLSVELPAPVPAADLSELRSSLLGYCLTLTGSKWEAEDLVQDICLKALPVIQGVKYHENARAYLFRAARNQWIDQMRRRKVLERKVADLEYQLQLESHAEIDRDDVSYAIRLVLKQLSPLQRCVFLLRDVLSYSSREVADKLNMTEGAVKSALYRARTALVSVNLTKEGQSSFDSSFSDFQQSQAKLHLYLLAIRHEDADLLIQMLNNDLAEPDILINKLQSDLIQPHSLRVNQTLSLAA
ncbi:RNA polymerase sigma factor [Paenibacillus zeisoli]|uniref:RNA polymerase sigma factor n=1 Tax=Paenibacillus zeisoli TaxID=2496267 RepID=A0A3S1B6R0_9BACL|nr:RNA polymerase sigma factor [Paenibacillus zeisoli]RUT29912.1 RNA polymerase sigma factor [Paenibacillus zeisoli]